jgi:hypothetical protein
MTRPYVERDASRSATSDELRAPPAAPSSFRNVASRWKTRAGVRSRIFSPGESAAAASAARALSSARVTDASAASVCAFSTSAAVIAHASSSTAARAASAAATSAACASRAAAASARDATASACAPAAERSAAAAAASASAARAVSAATRAESAETSSACAAAAATAVDDASDSSALSASRAAVKCTSIGCKVRDGGTLNAETQSLTADMLTMPDMHKHLEKNNKAPPLLHASSTPRAPPEWHAHFFSSRC